MYSLAFCCCKQKTAYEMRISDWSSDVCASDLGHVALGVGGAGEHDAFGVRDPRVVARRAPAHSSTRLARGALLRALGFHLLLDHRLQARAEPVAAVVLRPLPGRDGDHRLKQAPRCANRSEEHTSELQSLMRNSYAVFCLKQKKTYHNRTPTSTQST